MSIRTATSGGVATIEMARPAKKNALTVAMYQALTEAVNAASADEGVRALLIAGEGGDFTAGNDIADFLQHPPADESAPGFTFMQALAACEKPVVAAVTGVAVGIGTTMLLHCDLVYVAEDARFAMPFVKLGLVPEFASSVLLPYLMGYAKASEKLLLGEPFSGAEAVELGIANAALPANDVLPHARQIAERFNSLSADAVRESKRLIRAGLREVVANAIRTEGRIFVERLRSPEARAALEHVLQKRKP